MTYSSQFIRRLLRAMLLSIVFASTSVWWLAAADSPKEVNFDIAAGPALKALKEFSAQSGQQLLYANADLAGVATNEVKGRLTIGDALIRLLAGTPLTASRASNNGAVAVGRAPRETSGPNGRRAAQASDRPRTPSKADVANQDEDLVTLSAFRVTTTQDKGYVVPNSGTAFRTQQNLLDIPQAIQVLTRDLIDDIGAFDTSDILMFAGGQARDQGEFYNLRGHGIGYALIDGTVDRSAYMDNIFVDSYEIIKGPSAVFYPNTNLGGVVVKNTRKPLSRRLNKVNVRVDHHGLYRAEVDSTGPVGSIGSVNVGYRVLAGFQDGDAYFHNVEDKRVLFHPSVKFDYKDTSLLLAYDYQQITRPSNSTGWVTPDGDVFTGRGREMVYFLPPGVNEVFTHRGVRAILVHTFSPDWEFRLVPGMNVYDRKGSIVTAAWGLNYDTREVGLMNRLNDQKLEHYNVAVDVNGRYELFGRKNQSTFGVNLSNQKTLNQFWINPEFGTPGRGISGVGQQLWVSFDYDVDAIRPKPQGEFVPPANPGSSVNAYYGNFFFQQIAEILPNRLSLTAGISYYTNETYNNQNLAVFPPVTATVSSYVPQHRVGFVFTITKNLRVYGIDSTTSLPPSAFKNEDGQVLPPAEAKGKEVGLKSSFLDDRLYAAAGVFDYTTSGGSGGIGGFLPNGETFVTKAGTRRAKGWDIDLAFRLTKNWQLLANYFSAGGAQDDRGNDVPEYASSTWSFFTRYNFEQYRLSIGGGANHSKGRSITSSGLTYAGRPTRIPLKDAPLVNAFASYRFNAHLSFNLNISNVFDESFVLAAVTAWQVAPTRPRTITLTGTYQF